MASAHNIPFVVPPLKYCMDNAVMVAWTGIERYKIGIFNDAVGP